MLDLLKNAVLAIRIWAGALVEVIGLQQKMQG